MSRSISLQNGHRRQTAIIIQNKPIFSEKAEQLLREAMEKFNVYKKANLNVENMSTALVESFKTTLNVIHDKRTSFGHSTGVRLRWQ